MAFRKMAPISASAAGDITVLMIWHRVWMALLLVGRVVGLLQFLTSWLARGVMASVLDACAFFADIGHIAGGVDDHVAGMILDCGIRVSFRIVY